MRQILHIARREALEQRRQPVMLAVMASLFGLVTLGAVATLFLLQQALDDPRTADLLADLVGFTPAVGHALGVSALHVLSFLGFSQYLGIGAVLAGHGMIHERQCGTLTFLLLAPVKRIELVAGKVIGSLWWPTLLYVAIVGLGSLFASWSPLSAEAPYLTPRAASWWLAFLVGGPLWASAVATACTLVSAVARDVRSAQQGVWFIVFFATLAAGTLLTAGLSQGMGVQLVSAAAALATTATLLSLGSVVVSRDVGR